MKYLAIHHTAVSREKQSNQLYAVNRYHQEKWGMQSSLGWYVGYNTFIDVNGSVTKTRSIGEETIAQKGHNCDVESRCDTISVCLAGNFNEELPNDNQINTLRKYIGEIKKDYPGIMVTFHRHLQDNRTCPGILFTNDYLNVRIIGGTQVKDDSVDKEKSQKITQLQSQLDSLRAVLAKLMALLSNKNYA